MKNQASLSVVIPVGPAESAHLQLVQRLSEFSPLHPRVPVQIVLSHCQSQAPVHTPTDRSIDGIDFLRVFGPAGRAAQLNRGVAASSGRCLWLLHADSRPTPAALACAAAFAKSRHQRGAPAELGWFPLSFATDGPRLAALNAAGANLRSQILKLPFGDQAWLLERSTFDALGGFDERFGRGEDLDFIRRARHAGVRLSRQRAVVVTSARRYHEQGWLRTTLTHVWLTLRLWLESGRKLGNPRK